MRSSSNVWILLNGLKACQLMLLNPNTTTSLFSLIPLCMYSFSSPLPYDPSHGSPGGGGGEKASTWTLLRSPECMSLSVDALDGEEVALVPNSLKPPGAGDDAAVGGSGMPATQIKSNSRVNELLECPVCTNTMYPPIHQVRSFFLPFSGFSVPPRY